jgi:hypothetical protein
LSEKILIGSNPSMAVQTTVKRMMIQRLHAFSRIQPRVGARALSGLTKYHVMPFGLRVGSKSLFPSLSFRHFASRVSFCFVLFCSDSEFAY